MTQQPRCLQLNRSRDVKHLIRPGAAWFANAVGYSVSSRRPALPLSLMVLGSGNGKSGHHKKWQLTRVVAFLEPIYAE
jgi:hypothetical protein